jgi:ribosome-associated heat shock protein Hsp15
VVGIVERRLPAKDVPTYCLDLTPEEEMAKLNPPKETIFISRERGAGRPTKKERRDLDALWEQF